MVGDGGRDCGCRRGWYLFTSFGVLCLCRRVADGAFRIIYFLSFFKLLLLLSVMILSLIDKFINFYCYL